jgi:uncharacterized membrane protein
MIDTLWGLALALAVFCLAHLAPSAVPGLRTALREKLGLGGYRAIFSVIALGSLIWIILGHKYAPYEELWSSPGWTRLIPLAAMPLVMIMFACAQKSKGMRAITRHPMLWAVLLWAGAHIPVNGDAASVMMFGAFALYALIDIPLADRRIAKEDPERWATLSAETSALPFAAIIGGRATFRLKELGLGRVVGALLIFIVILFAHEHVIGLSSLP